MSSGFWEHMLRPWQHSMFLVCLSNRTNCRVAIVDDFRNFLSWVVCFHWTWSDHELNQARHMQKTFGEIIETMGGQVLSTIHDDGADAIAKPGEIIHEVGGVMMGDDPSRSVLNEFCQSWEVDNLFVADGGCFVSNADKNPTLSIMAIAWRASDYIVGQMNQRNL